MALCQIFDIEKGKRVTKTFTTESAQFVKLIETAAVFTGKDDTLPVLTCVRLERHGRYLIAAATDRFRLAAVRIDVDWEPGAPDDWATMIMGDDLKQVVSSYKSVKRGRVTLASSVNSLVVSCTGSAVALTIAPADYEFPQWRGLLAKRS